MTTPNRIQSVRDAYANLPEEQKQNFAMAIHKINPDIFVAWYRRAKISGQRPAAAASRPLGVGPRLDKALLKPPPQKRDLLPDLTFFFFMDEKLAWYKGLKDSLKDATTDNVEAKLRAKLDSMELEHGADPFWSLFFARSELRPEDWLSDESNAPRTGEETIGLESIDEQPESTDDQPEIPENEAVAEKRDAAITNPKVEGKSDAECEIVNDIGGMFNLAGLRKGEVLLSAFLLAQKTTNELLGRLPGEVNNLSLTDEVQAEELSAGFQRAIVAVIEAGRSSETWLSDLSVWLQTDELKYLATSEPVLETINTHAAGSRQTVDLLRNACEEVLKLLRELMSIIDARDKEMAAQLLEIQAVDDLLERPRFEPSVSLPTGDLLRGIKLEFVLGEQLPRARAERTAFLIAQKMAIQEQLEATYKHYDAAMLGADLETRFQEVRKAIQQIEDAASLTAARGAYEQLLEALRANPEVQSITDLASEALVGSPTASAVLPVARALNARGRASEALALLTCLQVATEVETSGPDDFSGLVDELMRASAELANAGSPSFAWIDGVFQQSWIRDLCYSDLQNTLTWQRLAVAFVVQEHLRGTEQDTDLFHHLEFQKFWPKERFPILGRLLRRIGTRQTLRVLPEAPASQRRDVESNLTEIFRKNDQGGYLRQAGKKDAFSKMVRSHLFPAMEGIREVVCTLCEKRDWVAARKAASPDPDKLLRKACSDADVDPNPSQFYRKMVLDPQTGYVPEFLQEINAFIDASMDDDQSDVEYVLSSDLFVEVEALESQQGGVASFWTAVRRTLSQAPIKGLHAVNSGEQLLGELCNRFGPVTTLATGFITALCSEGPEYKPARDTVEQMLRAIADPPLDCGLIKLQSGKCYRHARLVLDQLDPEARQKLSIEDLTALEARIREQLAQIESDFATRWPAVVAHSQASIIETDYQYFLTAGYFGYLQKMINAAEERVARASEEQRGEMGQWLHVQLDRLRLLKNSPVGEESAEAWLGTVFDHCNQLEKLLLMARTNATKGRSVDLDRSIFESAMDALSFVIENNSQMFDEVEACIGQLTRRESIEQSPSPISLEISLPEIAAPWKALSAMTEPIPERVRPVWESFARQFASATRLYHDLHKTLYFSAVAEYSWGRYATRFYDPRSGWLDREVRLYLCLGERILVSELDTLAQELAKNPESVNLVIVPNGMGRLMRLWKYDPYRSPYLMIGEDLLGRICAAKDQGGNPRHDIPLRQAIHQAAENLAVIGLFKSDGYVHQHKNLFVGRENALHQLTQQPASVIWGGRRTGKTSLLHALAERLKRPNITGGAYDAVALVYGDDDDMAIAQEIASGLKLEKPETLDQFKTIMRDACRDMRIAVLIDETDGYIRHSREIHGPTEFPLARILRGLSQSDADHRFKLVYAGFKQLFYQVRMTSCSDPSDPFKNIAEPVTKDFRNLKPEEVQKLMKISFEEMLGGSWDNAAPRLIFEKTSGHPAFVQYFCERLLERLSNRRKAGTPLRIAIEDVNEVYGEQSAFGTTGKAFIDYVNETLNWNVSHLGRVILLTIYHDIASSKATSGKAFSAQKILESIKKLSVDPSHEPAKVDFESAIHMLTMTNMLTAENPGTGLCYKMTYPAYLEFMRRLDQTGEQEIYASLEAYHNNERGKIK